MDFRSVPLWTNLLIFAGAAAVVWLMGTRLARYADAIGARTKLSKAFLGLILLGVATSLPAIVTTVTAGLLGNGRLVAGNLFGGVALQTAVLSIADVVAVRRALSVSRSRCSSSATSRTRARSSQPPISRHCSPPGWGWSSPVSTCWGCSNAGTTLFRMGFDSFGVLVTYAVGVVGLYVLRS